MRRLHRRAARQADGQFVVEGPQAVREALAAGALTVLYSTGRLPELDDAAAARGVRRYRVSDAVLAAMAETETPQGVVGLAPLLPPGLERLPPRLRLVAVLDRVADPGNAGTVLRTADAAGADAVVFTAGSTDPHGGKCVRASAGSLWHLPVVHGVAVDTVLPALRARGLAVLATSGTGPADLDDLLDRGALAEPTAWLFGSEAHGLDPDVLAAADRSVRVPLHGRAESLNLAAAAAVCLYASARQQRRRPRSS